MINYHCNAVIRYKIIKSKLLFFVFFRFWTQTFILKNVLLVFFTHPAFLQCFFLRQFLWRLDQFPLLCCCILQAFRLRWLKESYLRVHSLHIEVPDGPLLEKIEVIRVLFWTMLHNAVNRPELFTFLIQKLWQILKYFDFFSTWIFKSLHTQTMPFHERYIVP